MSQKIIIGGHGGKGSNGYRAYAYAYNNDKCEYRGFETFEDLFDGLISQQVFKAVVPYESSIIGKTKPVHRVLEDMRERGVELIEDATFSIPIYHALISGPASGLEQVKKVYSYELALEQCSDAIARMGLERINYGDAHAAIVHVVARNRPDEAALGPIDAAEELGGKILKDDMSNSENNMMRYKVFKLA